MDEENILAPGFRHEGADREHLLRDGERHDKLLYGLLRREWQATR